MPLIPVTWLDAQTVNTTTADNQSQPNIAQLSNGNLLVTWTTSHVTGDGSPAGTEVFAQLYDPLGVAIGTEFRINGASTADNERDSDIVTLPGGGFIVIYHDDDINNLGGSNIRLEEFDATGLSVPDSTSVIADAGAPGVPNYANPRGAASSATSVMIVYDKIEAGITGVFCKLYDPTTNTYGVEIAVMTGGITHEADIAVLTNGNYVIVAHNSAGDSSITYRILDAAGVNVLGSSFVSGTNTNGDDDFEPTVTALTGGGFVIASTNTDAIDTDIFFHVYNAAGTQTGSGIISGSATDNNNEPAVTGLADGSFIIAYDDDETDQGVVSHISATGTILGEFVFNGPLTALAITALADGRFAVTYQDGTDIHMEIFDTRDVVNNPGVYDPDQWQVGTVGDDVFTAGSLTDITHGWTGNDIITEVNVSSVQQYFGDAGNDTLIVVSPVSDDIHDGGIGIDTIDWLGSGPNGLTFDLDAGTATNGTSTEVMVGFENLNGTAGNDTILGTAGGNLLSGNAGNDTINGAGGSDTLFGSAGNDSLNGGSSSDTLSGGSGSDTLDGGTGADTLTGGTSSDTYIVDGLADVINEVTAEGTDRVLARANFVLAADDSIETLQTIASASLTAINLTGNALAQVLLGNAGANQLDGREGQDTMTGGAGLDNFVFGTAMAATNVDFITDFAVGVDEILLEGGIFTGIGNGPMNNNRFHAGASGQATSAAERIIYETDTGNLWYDADGTGATARVQFGDLAGGLAVTFNDFTVF